MTDPARATVHMAEDDTGDLYQCPLLDRGRRCGKCGRGVFRATRWATTECKVCGAEHWVGVLRRVVR